MTHLRILTTAAVLSAFALFSALIALARDSAPPDAIPAAQAQQPAPDDRADAKQFRMILTYHGDSDKPFYNLTLSVRRSPQQENPFALFAQIGEEQAAKIIKQLSDSGFFKQAQVTQTQDDPKTGTQYLLRVRIGDRHYQETLGWDAGPLSASTSFARRSTATPRN